MDEIGLRQAACKLAKNFLCATFCSREHNGLLRSFLQQQANQDWKLSIVIHGDVVLIDRSTVDGIN